MPKNRRIQVRFHEGSDLVKQIESRGSDLSDSIRESLTRYYEQLEGSREELRGRFSPEELDIITRMNRGDDVRVSWSLAQKLNKLSPVQNCALLDACERYWQAVAHGFTPEVSQLLE